MIKQMEMTGKNQEDAIARALDKLGLDRDDVSVEVLELGKTGFLGIGSVPAKVRLTFEVPDEEPAAAPEAAAEPEPPKAPAAPAPKPARAAEAPRPPKAKTPREPRPPKAPKAVKAPQTPPAPQPSPAKGSDAPDEEVRERLEGFLTGLMQHMGVNAVPKITGDGDTYEVVLEGEDLGALIGRRGETLDAIQQITGYVVNRGRVKRLRVHVDAENYRARREESLRRLANKVAGKVVRYRRSVTLEAMNAYERHVIHAALQDYPNVSTHSTGVEPNRRVVVSYDPGK